MVATFATEVTEVINQSEMAFRELRANWYRKGDALGGGSEGRGGGGRKRSRSNVQAMTPTSRIFGAR